MTFSKIIIKYFFFLFLLFNLIYAHAQNTKKYKQLLKTLENTKWENTDSSLAQQIKILTQLSVLNVKNSFLYFQKSHVYEKRSTFYHPVFENEIFDILIFNSLKASERCLYLINKIQKDPPKDYRNYFDKKISRVFITNYLKNRIQKLKKKKEQKDSLVLIHTKIQNDYIHILKHYHHLDKALENLLIYSLNDQNYFFSILDTMENSHSHILSSIDIYIQLAQSLEPNQEIRFDLQSIKYKNSKAQFEKKIHITKNKITYTNFETWLNNIKYHITKNHHYQRFIFDFENKLDSDFQKLIKKKSNYRDSIFISQITSINQKLQNFEGKDKAIILDYFKNRVKINWTLQNIKIYSAKADSFPNQINTKYIIQILKDIDNIDKVKDKWLDFFQKKYNPLIHLINNQDSIFKKIKKDFLDRLNQQLITEKKRYYSFTHFSEAERQQIALFKPYYFKILKAIKGEKITTDLLFQRNKSFVVGYEKNKKKEAFIAWLKGDSLINILYQKNKYSYLENYATAIFQKNHHFISLIHEKNLKTKTTKNSLWQFDQSLSQESTEANFLLNLAMDSLVYFARYDSLNKRYLCLSTTQVLHLLDSTGKHKQQIQLPIFSKVIDIVLKDNNYHIIGHIEDKMTKQSEALVVSFDIEKNKLSSIFQKENAFFIKVLKTLDGYLGLGYQDTPPLIFDLNSEDLFWEEW